MINFTIDARTIFQIGRESIESVTLAVSEVIKNSYDADASFCYIRIEENRVIFHDNGTGMSYDGLKNNWLRIGTDNKIKKPFTNKGRRKIGEKGIGRFALNRIGNIVEIYTKTSIESSYLKIDFNDFEVGENLQDISVKLEHTIKNKTKNQLLGDHGTIIVITDLLEEWDETLIEKIQLECSKLTSLNKSYLMLENNELIFNKDKIKKIKKEKNNDIFEIKLFNKKYPNKELREVERLEEYLNYSLFRMKINIDTSSMEYIYTFSFHPYEAMDVMKKGDRIESGKDIITDIYKRGATPLANMDIDLGKIEVELFAYDFSALVNKFSPLKKITPLKQVVKQNGGVKVYRDGQRVYNYGEPGIDWLELDSRRVNRPGRFLSNNVLVGNVYLNRNDTAILEEKTNREGFIANAGYQQFKKIIQSVVFEFSSKVEDVKYLIKKYLGDSKVTIDYDDTIDTLSQKIDSISDINEEDKKELHDGLFLVRKQLDFIKDVMLNTSIEVMDYLSIMHDLEKKLERMKELIENQDYDNSLVELINETDNLVVRQNNLIRDKSKKAYCLNEILTNIMYRSRYKFKANDVQVLEDYTETQGEYIKINKSSLIRIFDNLINNSLYWRMGNDDKIKISTKKTNRFVEVVFEDNGSGFKGDLEYLKEPFVTKKPGNEGLGLGLFIVGELMKNQNGTFEISNNSSIKDGSAKVRLIFPREDKDDD